jgi:hypothetical protein
MLNNFLLEFQPSASTYRSKHHQGFFLALLPGRKEKGFPNLEESSSHGIRLFLAPLPGK